MDRKVVLYIAMTLDGYIAKPNDDLSFLSLVEQEGEDYGYFDFLNTVDTVILGRKTFDWVMNEVSEYPYLDKTSFVISRSSIQSEGPIHFYNGQLNELISKLKNENGQDIFINGGAELVHGLLKNNLIDEFIISVIPIMVGNGIKLFKDGRPELELKLISSKGFEKGLVQLHYVRNN